MDLNIGQTCVDRCDQEGGRDREGARPGAPVGEPFQHLAGSLDTEGTSIHLVDRVRYRPGRIDLGPPDLRGSTTDATVVGRFYDRWVPRRSITGPPRAFTRRGAWPGTPKADAPPAVEYALRIAANLAMLVDERTVTEVAAAARVARSTIYDIINGTTWPDLVTVAHLETAFGVRLWPDELPAEQT